MTTIKNIAIVSAVYPPEPFSSSRISQDLANYLSDTGYSITVFCPQPSRPLAVDYKRYKNPDEALVTQEGAVKVVRLCSFSAPELNVTARMRESISFGFQVKKYLSDEKYLPDVLYVNSWPVFSQAIITGYAKKAGIPVVLHIMDIYPESLAGKLPPFFASLISLPFIWLDSRIAQRSAKVVVISENMCRTYTESRNVDPAAVIDIPTWQDETAFEHPSSRAECCRRYGISSDLFTFLFLGNIGPVAGVDFLIRAFVEADIPGAQLVIAGDGSAKAGCVELSSKLGLSRIHFVSDPDAANAPLIQCMAHVCMLSMKSGTGMSSIPSKLPSYLFSAKPVIATVDSNSDTARFVRQADCGWVGEPEDLMWLAEAMRKTSQLSKAQLDEKGQRGKQFALARFSKSSGVRQLADTITQVCKKSP